MGANGVLLASFFMPKIKSGGDGMDMQKFCDELFNAECIKDIPLVYVYRVVLFVFEILNSGKCLYNDYD